MTPTLGVVIPTFQRPEWVARAVGSLARQSRRPSYVVVVCRDTDLESHRAVEAVARLHAPAFEVRLEQVSFPGHMPPVELGLRVAARHCELVAVLDDDAEAEPDWLERMAALFAQPGVGAAGGGRYVNVDGDRVRPVPTRSVFGRIDFWGRPIGNLTCDPSSPEVREVEFLIGGNMAYRRETIDCLEFDMRLNEGVAFNYEVDLGLQVRRLGLRILFDPLARVRHFSAPRASVGMRRATSDSVRDYARNLTLILGRRLGGLRRARALAFFLCVGDRTAWGPGSAVADTLLRRRVGWRGTFIAAQRGKWEGLLLLLRSTSTGWDG